MDIKFDFNINSGRIILTYNEKGFQPKDVFAITGIAEHSKNIDAGKVEIGEKGIGFKSVFGVANRVLIQSGYFSFELNKDNFMLPIPMYDDYEYITGTKLTLFMPHSKVDQIFWNILDEYSTVDSLAHKNPILFLNKLTHLKIYTDSCRYAEFDVSRKTPQLIGDIEYEEEVLITFKGEYNHNGKHSKVDQGISCSRYTLPIVYRKAECVSRYGNDVSFNDRNHQLVIIVPSLETVQKNEKMKKGVLYSFLPTQMRMNVPLILHVPYKLDGSREYVDSQNNNQWFKYTNEKLSEFLKSTYKHLSTILKENIIWYYPKDEQSLVTCDDEKTRCLNTKDLNEKALQTEKIFYSTDGNYYNKSEVICIKGEIENPVEIFSLLGRKEKLFLTSPSISLRGYGIEIIDDVYTELLKKSFVDDTIAERAWEIISALEDFSVRDVISTMGLKFTEKHIEALGKNPTILKEINKYTLSCVDKSQKSKIELYGDYEKISQRIESLLIEAVNTIQWQHNVNSYFNGVMDKLYRSSLLPEKKYLLSDNGIILSSKSVVLSFANAIYKYDKDLLVYSYLCFEQASRNLDKADKLDYSPQDYLRLLSQERKKNSQTVIKRFIELINKAGADPYRFIQEIIQNADDCEYEVEKPTLILRHSENQLSVEYNEKGFTNKHVRAITAIGESTKQTLYGRSDAIGEKGVGFKSVFNVASEVAIHSGDFHFKLHKDNPILPVLYAKEDLKKQEGTMMVFELESKMPKDLLNEENLLRMCLCLRNLKDLKLGNIHIEISDDEKFRTITINNKVYTFEKIEYVFVINDEEAISERTNKHKDFSNEQSIICYLPEKDEMLKSYYVYNGLPTEIMINVPMTIDAPFELTTARDNILENKWNDIVKHNIYNAIIKVIHTKKFSEKVDVLRYIKTKDGGICDIFTSTYLNRVNLKEFVQNEAILPLSDDVRYVMPSSSSIYIIPDILFYLQHENVKLPKYVLQTFKRRQHYNTLLWLGCKEYSAKETLEQMVDVIDNYIDNAEFRNCLYNYLIDKCDEIRRSEGSILLNSLRIVPCKTENGTVFVAKNEKQLYYKEDKISSATYGILDTSVLNVDKFVKIFPEGITEFTQQIEDGMYVDTIRGIIRTESKEKAASIILTAFNNNEPRMLKIIRERGIPCDEIPMRMMSGKYEIGNKFTNLKHREFTGDIMRTMVVSTEYEHLAIAYRCRDIEIIHYEDIDMDIQKVSDEDISDISFCNNYAEIYTNLINNDLIDKNQIYEYDLSCFVEAKDSISDDEPFPYMRVKDIQRLRQQIYELSKRPNRLIQKTITVYKPERPLEKDPYLSNIYRFKEDNGYQFCQMCRKKHPQKFIERNYVEMVPDYTSSNELEYNDDKSELVPKTVWDQLYINLCLNCSKEYKLLRANQTSKDKFIKSILAVDCTTSNGTVTLEIGNRTISFTATHLAQIQEIILQKKSI